MTSANWEWSEKHLAAVILSRPRMNFLVRIVALVFFALTWIICISNGEFVPHDILVSNRWFPKYTTHAANE